MRGTVFSVRKKLSGLRRLGYVLAIAATTLLPLGLVAFPSRASAASLPAYRFTKVADVTNGSIQAVDVEVDSNNNVYMTGYFSGTVIFDGPGGSDSQTAQAGSTDSYLTKFNSSGAYEWTKILDTTSGNANGAGVAIDTQNNIYTVGTFLGTVLFDGPGGSDSQTAPGTSQSSYLTKYSSGGSYQWTKILDTTSGESSVTGVVVDSSGSAYVSGSFTGSIAFDGMGGSATYSAGPNQNGFINKYTSSGSYAWTKIFDASSGSVGNYAIAVDGQDNIYISGSFSDTIIFDGVGGTDSHTSGPPNAFITKYKNDGTYLWTKVLGSTPGSAASGYGIGIDSDGNLYFSGEFSGTIALDGSGGTDNRTSTNSDFFLIKYDAAADYAYGKTSLSGVGGGVFGTPNQLVIDKQGNVYITGYFSGLVTFDGISGTDIRAVPSSNSSTFLTMFNSAGGYGWTKNSNADNGNAVAGGIALDHQGNLYIVGGFDGTVIFNGSGGSDSHTVPPGSSNFFLTSYQVLPYATSTSLPGAPDTGFGSPDSRFSTILVYVFPAAAIFTLAGLINLLSRRSSRTRYMC